MTSARNQFSSARRSRYTSPRGELGPWEKRTARKARPESNSVASTHAGESPAALTNFGDKRRCFGVDRPGSLERRKSARDAGFNSIFTMTPMRLSVGKSLTGTSGGRGHFAACGVEGHADTWINRGFAEQCRPHGGDDSRNQARPCCNSISSAWRNQVDAIVHGQSRKSRDGAMQSSILRGNGHDHKRESINCLKAWRAGSNPAALTIPLVPYGRVDAKRNSVCAESSRPEQRASLGVAGWSSEPASILLVQQMGPAMAVSDNETKPSTEALSQFTLPVARKGWSRSHVSQARQLNSAGRQFNFARRDWVCKRRHNVERYHETQQKVPACNPFWDRRNGFGVDRLGLVERMQSRP